MTRLLSAMVVMTSITAFASSFTNLNVAFNVSPNNGSGGNIGGSISGPGINLLAGGGTFFGWFNDFLGTPPGSVGGGDTTIFWEDAFGQIGSQTYANGDIALDPSFFNAGSFTFPTNGQDFTIVVPASLSVISGTILTSCPNNVCQTFTLTTNPGKLTLSFFYSQANGLYYGSAGSFVSTVPEPGTFGLLALGVASLARCWRQHRRD
jgi:hypothetical protein